LHYFLFTARNIKYAIPITITTATIIPNPMPASNIPGYYIART